MIIGVDFFRGAKAEEHEEIESLLLAAFGRPDEATLVRQLRADGDMWAEVVAPWQGVVAGYAALSRMRAPDDWACLAPVAVVPRLQRGAAARKPGHGHGFNIGTRMVNMLTYIVGTRAGTFPHTIVVVGKPSFYERAGFSLGRAQQLSSPYPLSQTLIARRGDDIPEEELVYPRAFGI